MALTGRRDLFGREYLKDLNATAAARRAGYAEASAAVEGCRLLADPEVQAHIAQLAQGRNERLELDADTIIVELLRMLTVDPLQCCDEDGRVLRLADIPLEARRAIASFEVDTVGSAQTVTRTKVKFWSKEKAAELLGRHLTLFKEVLKVEGLDDLAKRIVEARKRADEPCDPLIG